MYSLFRCLDTPRSTWMAHLTHNSCRTAMLYHFRVFSVWLCCRRARSAWYIVYNDIEISKNDVPCSPIRDSGNFLVPEVQVPMVCVIVISQQSQLQCHEITIIIQQCAYMPTFYLQQ